jgi:CRP-like cAMP-binding protein
MWTLFIANIERRNIRLTEAELDLVKRSFIHRRFRKHQYILQEGQVSAYDNFVVRGLVRTYRVDEKGYEHILRFSPEDWWAGDLASFLSGAPSIYNADCLEDTELLSISYSDLESLFEAVPKMNAYFRILYQRSIISYNIRLTSSLTKSASERYSEFIQRYPQIEQRVPNHQIASYLGITPQSLSRIRKQSMLKGN